MDGQEHHRHDRDAAVDLLLREARPVARPGATRGHQPEDHGQGEQNQGDDAAGPRWRTRDRWSSRPPLGPTAEGEDLPIVAQQPNGLVEGPKRLEGLIAPDQRGSRQGVGVDTAGAGGGHQAPIRGRRCARWRGRQCDVPARSPSARSGPRCSNWPVRPDGWRRPGPRRRPPQTSPRRCRWPIPRVVALRRRQCRLRC